MAGEKMQRELEMLKNTWQILIFVLSLHIFLNECENVIKNAIRITITWAKM